MNAFIVRFVSGIAALLMGVVVLAGAEQVAQTSLFPPPYDKAAHFVYYGVMAGFWAHAFGIQRLWVALVLAPLVGTLDEWQQIFIVGREASVWDWTADVVGVLVFVYVYRWWAMRGRSWESAK
ncbi:MAG: VanZ family protein [Burkholderiales bacterium]